MPAANYARKSIPESFHKMWPLTPYRLLLDLLSPGGPNGRLSILIYHRVLPERDPLFTDAVDVQTFDRQLALLSEFFKVMPLYDAVHALHQGKLPPRAACITFDDGYSDNFEIALPILQKYGLPAAFFIAIGFLDGGRMWSDTVIELVRQAPGELLNLEDIGFGSFPIASSAARGAAIWSLLARLKYLPMKMRQLQVERMCELIPAVLPDNLMMTSEQVKRLHSSGMEIGAHTINHPILARIDSAAAYNEIAGGKELLEALVRGPVRSFAYPNGKPGQDYLSEHVSLVKRSGFEAAVSTSWGAASGSCSLYELPRFTPWGHGSTQFALQMAKNMLRPSQDSRAA